MTTTTTTAIAAECCTTHDGGHVHGCTIPRDGGGLEHRGECARPIRSDTLYPFCPAWCLGHEDGEDPYVVDEQSLDANRWEPGMPELADGDVIFTHSGDNARPSGRTRSAMWLRRFDRARGGNVVTGGGTLEQGEVMLLIQGEGIDAPASLTLEAADGLAADIIATHDALLNLEDHR